MSTIFLFRKFNCVVLLLFLLFSFQQISFSQFANSPLDPTTKNKFEDKLPVVKDLGLRYDVTNLTDKIVVKMKETTQYLGVKPGGTAHNTTVWGYEFPGIGVPTYPGATMIAKEKARVMIRWENELPGHFLPVDPTLHMAHPNSIHTIDDVRDWYFAGNVPTVAHLHGGNTESASDGLPEAWFTQGFGEKGNYFVKKNYRYDNTQEAATLWYHDHALGITRLNVYMGLAGFYLLRDDNEENLINTGVLPSGDQEIELVIQDKMFDTDGELFWPAYNTEEPYDEFIDALNPLPSDDFPDRGGPTALAEFFGDYILVNAMTWPYLEVEPRKYRFRLLNGSDSRFYLLEFRNNEMESYSDGSDLDFLQIGTDDGLLEKPVKLHQLLIAPGERMDLVVDFSSITPGNSIYLRNFGPDEPFGGGEPDDPDAFDAADPNTTGQVMRFDIVGNVPTTDVTVAEGTTLRSPIVPLVKTGETRNLVLFEGMDNYGRLMPMLGTLAEGSLTWGDPITENPMKNDVEIWEVYNATGDAHPIHLHLVKFQILNREPFSTGDGEEIEVEEKNQVLHNGEIGTGGILHEEDVELSGDVNEPADNEKGWKDTAVMLPGQVTRVIAKFDRNGRYVWHCHILSHEDHEMMRPFQVGPIPRHKVSGDVVLANVTDFKLDQNYPNPFNPSTVINFSIPTENTLVSLKIYNSIGQEVGTLINQVVPAGNHEVQFDAIGLPSGVYFYTLTAGNFVDSKKMIVLK